MNNQPLLSIVTPTRGNFSGYWLEQLLKVKGNVQFVLVYPLGTTLIVPDDPRFKVLVSPHKGELEQRFMGLLNTSGKYVLALDDDDFVHPDILELVVKYFNKFPESWVLRLKMNNINYTNQEIIQANWEALPNLDELKVVKRTEQKDLTVLQEVPIAPLNNKFDIWTAIWPFLRRKDMCGPHIENFNNKVWKNDLVQQVLCELSRNMRIIGPLTWMPFWSLDRLLGLFIQAKLFQENITIGHWILPNTEQIRYIEKPSSMKEIRSMFPADALLTKSFPQYGYFWNLFFDELYIALKLIGRNAIKKLLHFFGLGSLLELKRDEG